MKIIIAGSRSIIDSAEVLAAIRDAGLTWGEKFDPSRDIILSGAAPGPDTAGADIMRQVGFTIEPHPAQWTVYGKRAGSLRNQEMVDLADRAIFIWDGVSRGTSNCIRMFEMKMAKTVGLKVYIHKVQPSVAAA